MDMDASLDATGFPQPPTNKIPVPALRKRQSNRPTINTASTGKVAQAVQRLSALHMTPPLTPVTPSVASTTTTRQSQIISPVSEEPSFHNYLRAFYHFHPTAPVSSVSEESSITVPINQGDIILVHSIQPNGWADGTLLTSGARGWLPTNYCEAFDHDVIRNLLSALTNVWEFVRGHEDGDISVFATQDYVRGMIAGVRVFLERAQCLNRDSPLVQSHSGLRRMRKAILGELSSFVKSARQLQEICHGPIPPEVLYNHLDDIVLKAFKVVTRAVKFLDCWSQDVYPTQLHGLSPSITTDMPLTPPADGISPQTPNPGAFLSVPDSRRGEASVAVTPAEDTAHYPDYNTARPSSMAGDPASHTEQQSQPRSSQRLSAAFAPHAFTGQRPSSITSKRTSISHRWSHHANLRSAIPRSHVLASERLNSSHDSFLGSLGAYIGLHMQSRWSMDLLVTTQHSVTSCQSLLAVVDEVYARDYRRSEPLEAAKEMMEASLADLVQATRDIFRVCDASDEAAVFMPDQGKRLVDAATLCVRSAGECVSKTKIVIERIGDFDFEPVDFGSTQGRVEAEHIAEEQAPPAYEDSAQAGNNDGLELIDQLPLPPLPPQARDSIVSEQMMPPLRPAPSPTTNEFENVAAPEETLVPAPLRTAALRATSQASVSRSSCETVVPRDENTQTPTPGLRKTPSLDVEIPRMTGFDFSPSPTESTGSGRALGTNPARTDSVGVSSADTSSYMSSLRRSEQSLLSRASTRATTPDQDSEKARSFDEHTSFGSLSDSRDTIAEESEDVENQFLVKTYAHELVFNKDGQVSGGSLPALVERLTMHDATPDVIFVNTFYLTFRLFTTPTEFAQALVDRFEFAGDGHDFATPVRLRVYNVFKGWLESHWRPETDTEALRIILHFATGRLKECLPTASKRLVELTTKLSDATNKPVGQRLLAAVGKTTLGSNLPVVADGPTPNPVISKSQLNALRNAKNGGVCSILDFDALELARQFTLIESRVFCAIQPEELLALEWTKKNGSRAVNVKAKSGLSTDLANLVADSILQLEEPKKRALIIKHWVKIAKKCHQLNNYDSLMAIICSLNSSMVLRLKRTWDCVSPKTTAKLDEMKRLVDVSKNYATLRQQLQFQVAPCLPFVGIYLTDLTFVDVGNQSTRQLSTAGLDGEQMSVINFDKQIKTARIIGDLQRFQVPYRLTPVPEMQEWMESQIMRMHESEQADVQHFYRRSQMLEPREASKLAVPKLQASESFPGASGKPDTPAVREKLDFWNQFHLPSKDKLQG